MFASQILVRTGQKTPSTQINCSVVFNKPNSGNHRQIFLRLSETQAAPLIVAPSKDRTDCPIRTNNRRHMQARPVRNAAKQNKVFYPLPDYTAKVLGLQPDWPGKVKRRPHRYFSRRVSIVISSYTAQIIIMICIHTIAGTQPSKYKSFTLCPIILQKY